MSKKTNPIAEQGAVGEADSYNLAILRKFFCRGCLWQSASPDATKNPRAVGAHSVRP